MANPPLQSIFNSATGNPVFNNLTNEYISLSDLSTNYSNVKYDLCCLHLNIQSLNSKLIEFNNLINEINCSGKVELDVIALTEIWSTNLMFFHNILPGYSFIYEPPKDSHVGGVAFFIKDNIVIERLNESSLASADDCQVESLFLKLRKGSKTFTTGVIYRHPSINIDEFKNRLENCIGTLSSRYPVWLFGDFNINLLNYSTEAKVTRFTDMMLMNYFMPLILLPTRITPTSTSLIDHIYIREADMHTAQTKYVAGNLIDKISDHLPNFCFLQTTDSNPDRSERPTIRVFNEKSNSTFTHKLSLIDWNQLLDTSSDTDSCYNLFETKLNEIYEASYPLKKLSRKAHKNKPWFTPGLKKSRAKNASLYKKWLKSKSVADHMNYKNYNKIYKTSLKCSYTLYYNNQFSLKANSIKKVWVNLNQFLSTKVKSKGVHIEKLTIDGSQSTDPDDICNELNKHFCNVGPKAVENLSTGNGHFSDYLGPPTSETLFVSPVTALEIEQTIDSLAISKAAGEDGFTAKLIKNNKAFLVPPLVRIYNMSLSQGAVPKKLKVAKVIPVFKKGDPTDPNNYRPISLLSAFDKILEKVVYSRLINFLNKHNTLFKYQFGFRKNHSTSLALIEIVDKCYKLIDDKNWVVGIFVDFEKAFDTVNHDILLSKCFHYGIRGPMFSWLESYLSRRSQFTVVNGTSSSVGHLTHGIPQGSILGPLLYLIYVNDIGNISAELNPRLFADDTNIFLESRCLDLLKAKANEALQNFSNWCLVNKLKINVKKTSFCLFKRKQIADPDDFKLYLQGQEIQRQPSTKYLGVHIDEDLSWESHINFISEKLMKLCGIFYKIRNFLPMETINTLYYALVNSKIIYGIEVYANTFQTYLDKLIKLNNRILRIMYNKKLRTHVKDLYIMGNNLPINQLHELFILKFVHKATKGGSLPEIFSDYFKNINQGSQYSFRQLNNLQVPRLNTVLGQRCCQYKGPNLWNRLPSELKSVNSYGVFCKLVKAHLQCNL